MKRIFFTTIIAIFLIACSTKDFPLDTVKSVDINKYQGTWYEIARFEHFFEKGCKNVRANYSLIEDNKIKVINSCQNIETNKTKEATGIAYATDNTNSKLKVSFFRPFYGDYWILFLDKDYKYALIGAPSREYFWILSRTKTLNKKTIDSLLLKMKELMFDKDRLIWTIQE